MSSDTQTKAKQAIKDVERRLKVEIQFPVLSDVQRQTIGAYNVTDPLNARLARPVTYIIDENGTIRWKFFDIRVADRIDPVKIIDELKKLE